MAVSKRQKQRLGKGLSALLGEYAGEAPGAADGEVERLPISRLLPNPFQPRREVAQDKLEELIASIRENGLLQPLVVRPAGDGWQIVAGERRWRAITELGWADIPAYIRKVDDQTMLVLALIENLQREELSPVDEAHAYQRLIDEFGMTQGDVAEQVGRNRSTVANTIRLLGLPDKVLGMIAGGALSAGHARALLTLDEPAAMIALAGQAASDGWSVRELESRVRGPRPAAQKKRRKSRAGGPAGAGGGDATEPYARRAAQALGRALGTNVRVKVVDKTSGHIEIPFRDPEDFERIVEVIVGVGGIV